VRLLIPPLQEKNLKRTSIIQVTITLLLFLAFLTACQPSAEQPPSLPETTETQPILVASGVKSSAVPHVRPATAMPYPNAEAEPIETKPAEVITATNTVSSTVKPPASPWNSPLPILLIDNQGLTLGPGQIVSVYAEGFQPDEDIAVAVIHETQGVVFNKTAKADALGHVQTARRLTKTAQDKDALPAGSYTYQLTGANQVQKFTFQVDYQYQAKTNGKSGCGTYPTEAVFEGHLAIFCLGLQLNTSYTLTAKQGEKYDAIVTTSDPFGWIVFPLRLTSETLGPGTWIFSLGKTATPTGTPLELGFPTISVPVLSPQEVNQ